MKKLTLLVILLILVLGAVVNAQDDTTITFASTQFNVVEESEKARAILANFEGGTVDFTGYEAGPLLDLLRAEAQSGSGTVDVVGDLHGSFPTYANEDLMFDLTDLLASIEETTDVNDSFVELGKMGTTDYQYYIPWMQATYIMAANKQALEYVPEGADINALSWDELAQWGKNMMDATGEAKLGFPVAGLFHRFLEGYAFPSFTGGMVTQFRSAAAADMMTFMRDDLWPVVNPESINYDFMQEPLLSGEVWVAFDHVARLKQAFDEQPDDFVAFPAPAGPAGRGYMPVVASLGIPFTAPNPDAAESLIRFMMEPSTQGAILRDLGFFPVVGGVDTADLPQGVAIELGAVNDTINAPDAIPSLLPVGLGARGGEINEIFRNAFNRVVINGEDIQTVLDEEGTTLQTLLTETGAACWAPDPPSEGVCQVQ
ncbi:MAG: extracellular solute-binding protein [Anaerolineae bacterium]|nr:extracellular solute-binding protein [Anaerolineae bacterium]